MSVQIESQLLFDDGLVPNNPRLPLVIYRGALSPVSEGRPEEAFRTLFARNGWEGAWVNGIYAFHHYHARCHEVLGIAAGSAEVQFGGDMGPVLRLAAGDAVVIPAGVGHCRRDRRAGLVVVGAYPAGQDDVDLKRATIEERTMALAEIPRVFLPERDPVTGTQGGLGALWR